MTLEGEFAKFLAGDYRSQWIEVDPIAVYLRQTERYMGGKRVPTLDIANVIVFPKKNEGKGYLREFMLLAEKQTKFDWLFLENVLSPRMEVIARKNGWEVYGSLPQCFYKRLR